MDLLKKNSMVLAEISGMLKRIFNFSALTKRAQERKILILSSGSVYPMLK